jgi:hypothetical protein
MCSHSLSCLAPISVRQSQSGPLIRAQVRVGPKVSLPNFSTLFFSLLILSDHQKFNPINTNTPATFLLFCRRTRGRTNLSIRYSYPVLDIIPAHLAHPSRRFAANLHSLNSPRKKKGRLFSRQSPHFTLRDPIHFDHLN